MLAIQNGMQSIFMAKTNSHQILSKYQDDIYNNFSKLDEQNFPQIDVESVDLYPTKDEHFLKIAKVSDEGISGNIPWQACCNKNV